MADMASAELVDRLRAGDQQAADELFYRFADKLATLAAGHLSERLARRLDPEDVVQSAYRSFFVKARAGRYSLERSGDLWRLLVGITLHKLQHQAERHTAKKRAVSQEVRGNDGLSHVAYLSTVAGREPTPLEAALLADEVHKLLSRLEPRQRPMLELRLQGYNFEEIAKELQCSERTVRRTLEQVRQFLQEAD